MENKVKQDTDINVLLIDDERDFLEQMKLFLKRENKIIKPDIVSSGSKALEKLSNNVYDCIVSDYQMPGMDGLDLLETIRKERNNDIPFIVFTGKGREEVAMRALNLGASRYIQKGGDPKSQYGVLAESIIQEVKRSKVEFEKKKVESEFSSVVKGSDNPIYIVDSNARILFANQAELDKTNMEYEEIIGTKFNKSHPNYDYEEFKKKLKEVIETGKPQKQEVKHKNTGKFYDRTLTPIKDPKTGEVNKVSVISDDVTKLKESEEEQKKLNSMLAAIRNVNQLIVREDNLKKLMNESCKVLKGSRDYLETFIILLNEENDIDLFAHSDIEDEGALNDFVGKEPSKCIKEVFGSKSYKIVANSDEYCKDCSYCNYEDSHKSIVVPIMHNEDVCGVLSTCLSINREVNEEELELLKEVANDLAFSIKKLEAEEKLEKNEREYNALFSNLDVGVSINKLIYNEEKDPVNYKFLNTNSALSKIFALKKEEIIGEKITEILGLNEPPYLKKFVEVVKNKEQKIIQDSFEPINKNLKINAFPINEDKFGILFSDRSEINSIKEREEFFHSLLRHDLKNKLNLSLGYSQLLKDTDLTEEQKEIIGKDWKAKHDAIKLTEDIEKLRKVNEESLKTIEISSLIEKAVQKFEQEAKQRNIKIETNIFETKVKGGSLLKDVFSNIILNGIVHSNGEKLVITMEQKEEKILVKIEDDGKGIPDEKKDQVFKKGFKDEETGMSGLGLYLVKQIIKNYRGKIKIKDSKLGGAKFEIHLKKSN